MANGTVTVVIGAQWGDEGKGKFVDYLGADADVVCRSQGGNNASHTVEVGKNVYHFHLLPTGILRDDCKALIGNGVVVHLPGLFEEIEKIEQQGLQDCQSRLLISDRSHLVFDFHQTADGFEESKRGKSKLGTIQRGIGPTYSSKVSRYGVRVGELIGEDFEIFAAKFKTIAQTYAGMYPNLNIDIPAELLRYKSLAEKIRPMVVDTVHYLTTGLKNGKRVLVEGANGFMLDIDFGTYPYVTSSNCSIGGVCTGLGIPPNRIGNVYGVVKAYLTRVSPGPFPTELVNETGQYMQRKGKEIGVIRGWTKRCGWLDLPMLKYSSAVNGFAAIALTKLDVLDELDEIKIGVNYWINGKRIDRYPSSDAELQQVQVEYITMPGWKSSIEKVRDFEQLPIQARQYVMKIEELLEIPVKWVAVGPERDAMITRSLDQNGHTNGVPIATF